MGDQELLAALLEYFERHADCIAVQVGETELDVALLGSYRNDVHAATVHRIVSDFRADRALFDD
ncbi:MAG TPA: hypothetical protein VLD16_10155 [Gaiellaceae bacterium]|nr:hypothetical protein [Gaiellaceae bacterium]